MVLNATTVPSARALGVELVRRADPQRASQDSPVTSAKSGAENEIPAARRLLSRIEVAGRLVSLDAMHTQHETAAQVVLEAGADYLLTLKDNQETMLQMAQTLVPGDFFSQDPETKQPRMTRTEEKNRGGLEIRQLVTREIQPAESGLIGPRQVARLDEERTEKGKPLRARCGSPPAAALKNCPPAGVADRSPPGMGY